MSPRAKALIKLALSVILLAIVARAIDFQAFLKVVRSTRLGFWPPMLILLFADRALMAYKWNLLLRAKGVSLPFLSVLRIYFIGSFFGFLLPATVGGDLSRLYTLRRSGQSVLPSASSIVAERLLGLLSLAALGIFSLVTAVRLDILPLDAASLSLFGLFVACAALVTVFLATDLAGPVLDALERRLPWRLWGKIRELYGSIRYSRHSRGIFVKVFLWSAAEHALTIFLTWVLALSLDIDLSIVYFLAFLPGTMLITRIPVTFNGVGVREGLFVLLFTRVGLSPSEAFAISIMSQVLYVISILPGLVFVAVGRRGAPADAAARGVNAGPQGVREP